MTLVKRFDIFAWLASRPEDRELYLWFLWHVLKRHELVELASEA